MNGSRDCWSCGKRPTECMGQAGPSDIEMACWVPAQTEPEVLTGHELTGETARKAHEAAERMRKGQQAAEAVWTAGEGLYEAVVQQVTQAERAEQDAAERALCSQRRPIIAVDFDGTLCESAWPEIGEAREAVIETVKIAQAAGARLILWTSRTGGRLAEAVAWCAARGLIFDAVNANLPETLERYGGDSRKITADIYLDDRATLPTGAALAAIWTAARDAAREERSRR